MADVYGEQIGQSIDDETWLTEAGRNGWVVLMKDAAIRRRPAELDALMTKSSIHSKPRFGVWFVSDADTGFTRRSDDPMDFLTFGQLSDVIKANWDVFGAVFSSSRAVEKVMANLNILRGPIAHCSPLAEDEVVRLRLTVADWFRLGD